MINGKMRQFLENDRRCFDTIVNLRYGGIIGVLLRYRKDLRNFSKQRI